MGMNKTYDIFTYTEYDRKGVYRFKGNANDETMYGNDGSDVNVSYTEDEAMVPNSAIVVGNGAYVNFGNLDYFFAGSEEKWEFYISFKSAVVGTILDNGNLAIEMRDPGYGTNQLYITVRGLETQVFINVDGNAFNNIRMKWDGSELVVLYNGNTIKFKDKNILLDSEYNVILDSSGNRIVANGFEHWGI